MTSEKPSRRRIKKDDRKLPQDSRSDEEISEQPSPPFLNEGPELVRDSHC